MRKLSAADLMSLEEYARERPAFRARLIELRRVRSLQVGEHCSWSFEDRLTVQYQIQEMLRTERIFEPAGISEELEAYNPLIPDGSNLKATLMIEYPDAAERAERLAQLRGFERRCWMRIGGFPPVYAIADEDLERDNQQKTAAVHFLRFEFAAPVVAAARGGAAMAAGVDHPHYRHSVDPLPESLRAALAQDFD
ncbi:MAG TPA: DUF3501 family protein [Steroidobacteraceae bacterium]|nr:DUF3501 family protein [Steroidobacteraceae bacterium]